MKDLYNRSIWSLSLIFVACVLNAQVYPGDKLVLNHTQVMFEYPQIPGADRYLIEIALLKSSVFNNGIIYSAYDSSVAHLVDHVLDFGNAYRWHYSAFSKDKKLMVSKDFSFEICHTFLKSDFRANAVIHDSSKIENGLILLDHGLVIDRKGKLILVTDSFGVEKRDFSLTSNGTLTYVQTITAYEKTLNGDIVWRSKEISTEKEVIHGYHHDLIKMKNGNYLVMCKVKELNDPNARKNLNEAIVEVDQNNKVVWLWKENAEISDTSTIKTTHLNSIFLDEEKNKLYVSGRDINTIFKIDRSTSKIESCIGRQLNDVSKHYPHHLFSGQHSAQLLSSGNILLFNNNTKLGRNSISSIVEINQPTQDKPTVKPQFGFLYMFEDPDDNFCAKGGDANKLKNGNYLVSSSSNNRNFEFTSSKKIVWECRPEKFDTTAKRWLPIGSYRINFTKTLYPYYTSVEWVYNASKITGYKITNDGSEQDELEIILKNSAGRILEKKQLILIAGASRVFMLEDKWPKRMVVEVVSKNNLKGRRAIVLN